MTIASYSDLQAAIGNWLDHSLFSARVPDFIALFEAAANRRLRVRQQEVLTSLSPATDGTVALPSDYLAWRRVTWTGQTRRELEFVHPSYFQATFPTRPADIPMFFTIEGSTLKVIPLNSTPLDFEYFQKVPALASIAPQDGTQTNWLLTTHPDVYLFGSLVEAEMFGVNDNRSALWKARRDEIFDDIEKLSNKTRAPSAPRVMGPTP